MKTLKILIFLIPIFLLLFTACTQDESQTDPLTGFSLKELNGEAPVDESLDLENTALRYRRGSFYSASVIDPITDGRDTEVGRAHLRRLPNGVGMTMNSSRLIPGHTYTVWWVVFNNPEHCAGAPCSSGDFSNGAVGVELMYATGKVVKRGNRQYFKAMLKEGDTSGSVNDIIGLPTAGGLLDAEKAEVHLVIRSHGPMIPGLVHEQITTLNGGCTTSLPAFTEIPDEEGECANIQFAIFL